MTTKPRVTHNGTTYVVRSARTEIPDFNSMTDLAVAIWLNQNTYARGTNHRRPNPLAGYGGILTVRS